MVIDDRRGYRFYCVMPSYSEISSTIRYSDNELILKRFPFSSFLRYPKDNFKTPFLFKRDIGFRLPSPLLVRMGSFNPFSCRALGAFITFNTSLPPPPPHHTHARSPSLPYSNHFDYNNKYGLPLTSYFLFDHMFNFMSPLPLRCINLISEIFY